MSGRSSGESPGCSSVDVVPSFSKKDVSFLLVCCLLGPGIGLCFGKKNFLDAFANVALKTNWYFLASATDLS